MLDCLVAQVLWKVVVIALEATLGNAEPGGERMQFFQRSIAYQVTPHAIAPRPVRLINKESHSGEEYGAAASLAQALGTAASIARKATSNECCLSSSSTAKGLLTSWLVS
jgi:hypothetical protein